MTSNAPTFTAGMQVWHVRHGKVTLHEAATKPKAHGLTVVIFPGNGTGVLHATEDGKEDPDDISRVLYTLAEAEQCGWHKPKPLREVSQEPRTKRVEFESIVHGTASDWADMGMLSHCKLARFEGKRVKVTIEEVHE